MKQKIVPISLVILVIGLNSCKTEPEFRPEVSSLNASEKQELYVNDSDKGLSAESKISYDIGKELVHLAEQDKNFKKMIELACLKQSNGDYEVRFSDLIDNREIQRTIPLEKLQNIIRLVEQMKKIRPERHPMLFIPSVETFDLDIHQSGNHELAGKSFSGVSARDDERIIIVSRDSKGENNKLFPGYIYDDSGIRQFYGMIDEKFAWNNNVWVIGYEEKVSLGNMVKHVPEPERSGGESGDVELMFRNPSRAEIGGRILVSDISQLESWVEGKLEMKYFVSNSTGLTIKERAFGKTTRSDLDNKWHDYNDLIGQWDSNIWGPYTYERWIEEDDGNPVTISTPITPVPGGPTYTISTTIQSEDENLGLASVHYSDPYYGQTPLLPSEWTVYNISYMSFQRWNKYQP